MDAMDTIKDSLTELFEIVNWLEKDFSKHNRKFTIDGHLIGSIGEVLVAEAYDLELAENSTPVLMRGQKQSLKRQYKSKQRRLSACPFPPSVKMIPFRIM